ncbi:MAG: PglZ domain-containing protein, partial [Thermodesulfobacteriota bacterium]|nr:PglZ domain-containing protein [Thermodesulfobacteriota bacterium]
QVKKEFFSRLNQWLERENINQPPATLAKEAAKKILGSLVSDKGEKRFKEVYKSWADSKKYEKSLNQYVGEETIPFGSDIWAVDISHPFVKIDKDWLTEISKNIENKKFIKKKLEIIKKRAADTTGQKLSSTLWNDVLCILKFDTSQINGLKTLDDTIRYYTNTFYKLDAAVRRLYSDFLNDNEIIQPFQENYNQVLIQLLDKWFTCFKNYKENQAGLLDELISSQKKCAVIVGDGISYDIARDVSEKIKTRYKVDNGYRLADFPSTTENNMTRIYMGSAKVEPVQKKRERYLVEKYGAAIQFAKLEEVTYTSEPSQFLICTYKDIDSIAEKIQQGALKFISQMVDELAEKIDQLMKCGYQKVYLTSDHGFVLTGKLAESNKVEFDFKGAVEKNERYVRTAEKQDASVWLVGIDQKSDGYEHVYFHKSNNPFKTPGLYGYAHGGISPQELVVPFICIERKSVDIKKLDVVIANKENLEAVVGDIFEISLKAGIGKEGLFSMQRKVEILFLSSGKQVNKSDIISLKQEEVVKKEYSFDGRNELDAIVIDAETKETIDRVTIKQKTIRDTGGLL